MTSAGAVTGGSVLGVGEVEGSGMSRWVGSSAGGVSDTSTQRT